MQRYKIVPIKSQILKGNIRLKIYILKNTNFIRNMVKINTDLSDFVKIH
jgi:hypothetical protein